MLDRDGVINELSAAGYVAAPDQWLPLPGSLAAIARLNSCGYQLAICTNQTAIGYGWMSEEDFFAVNNRMIQALHEVGGRIDLIAYCPHARDAGCSCRKPRPGMLLEVLDRTGRPPSEAWFVGDSERDLAAAEAAGVKPALVYSGETPETGKKQQTAAVPSFVDLAAFVDSILDPVSRP